MKITTQLTNSWLDGTRHYAVLVDGIDSGYRVCRFKHDWTHLVHNPEQASWMDATRQTVLSSTDLRKALPEARRIVAERIAETEMEVAE